MATTKKATATDDLDIFAMAATIPATTTASKTKAKAGFVMPGTENKISR